MSYCLKNEGSFDDIFLTEAELIDRYVGSRLWIWGYAGNEKTNICSGNRSSPMQTISQGTNWVSVTGGYTGPFSGIKTDGTLWIWGRNCNGSLANSSTIDQSSPVQTVSAGNNWKQSNINFNSSAAIKTDGTLWTWGCNCIGQLGTGNTISRSSPVQTVSQGTNWKQVSVGGFHTAAIKTDGTLWVWGGNYCGRLGIGTLEWCCDRGFGCCVCLGRSSPVQTISQGTNWKQISISQCDNAAIKTDGTLWLWGNNKYGTLGNGQGCCSLYFYDSPQCSPVQTVTQGNSWKQVDVSGTMTAAIKFDGTLWVWGLNSSGSLGIDSGLSLSYCSPIQTISKVTNWKYISVRSGVTSAIKTDGTLWLWGSNFNGDIGDNTTINRSSPVQTISKSTNWKSSWGSSAITFDGN